MPLRNRVTPWGTIVADSGRGLFFGNRGNLHRDDGAIVRRWKAKAWVTCLLEFRGRRRSLLQPGRYTELFFLDEATALAAGHRPCGECRRHDLARFKAAWATAFPDDTSLAAIDARLHRERIAGRSLQSTCDELPDGTYVEREGLAWLISGGRLHRWSAGRYVEHEPLPLGERLTVLTPPCTVAALRAGYQPVLHPSAATG